MAVRRRRPVKRNVTDQPKAPGELEVEEPAPVAVAEFAAVSLGGAEDGPTRYAGMLGDPNRG